MQQQQQGVPMDMMRGGGMDPRLMHHPAAQGSIHPSLMHPAMLQHQQQQAALAAQHQHQAALAAQHRHQVRANAARVTSLPIHFKRRGEASALFI